jgi:MFS family permease
VSASPDPPSVSTPGVPARHPADTPSHPEEGLVRPGGSDPGLWRRTFSSLSIRDYRIFFFGQGISLMGTWMRMTAQGWLVYDLTGSKLLLGTVTALGLLPLFLFSSVAGALADRFPKKRLLLLAQSFMMLVSVSVATLVASGQIQVWHLMVSASLIGIAFAVDLPARQSFYISGRAQGPAQRHRVELGGVQCGASWVRRLPAIMATFGMAACFYADAASFLAVITSVSCSCAHEPVRDGAQRSHRQMLRRGSPMSGKRTARILLFLLAATSVFGWSMSR